MADAPAHTNRLAGETSPYLLQHAHNPVDWWPWGPDALTRAQLLDKPIFLSIGYAACHWCHVMEQESFEDEATAALLNANFIPIKVDREERPDLDQIYMTAVQALTGQGGWPMSMFLTPQGRPFFGGTYFPDEPRHGMPSFRQVLEGVAQAWRQDRQGVEQAGGQVVQALLQGTTQAADATAGLPDAGTLDTATQHIEGQFDAHNGGWGRAPKFPQPMTIEYLLRRHVATGDARPLAIARRSLDAMQDGGIHDQLGRGFHRYSTTADWLVPHFEQMLYDNGQLARVYVHAWQLTGDAAYRATAEGVLDYLVRELTTADGGFAASQDADTEGEEGGTFVWTAAEIRSALAEAGAVERAVHSPTAEGGGTVPPPPEDLAALFAAGYGVTEGGNWEGSTILSRVQDDATLGERFGLDPADVSRRLALVREVLHARRGERPQPARDDKVLAGWNGLAIAALADAIRPLDATGDAADVARAERNREAARRAADLVLTKLRDPATGRLQRSWKDGRASAAGVLEDHALLADGLLALYEATWEDRWFVAARELLDLVLDRFADPAGGFFDTADDHEQLVTRPKDPQDNAIPSGGAMATTVLLRLAALTGDGRYRAAAERALASVGPYLSRYPTGFAQWLIALDFAHAPVSEVAIVGERLDAATRPLLRVLDAPYRPHQVLAGATDPTRSAVPLLADRERRDGRPTAYVCRDFACRLPVTDAEALAGELAAVLA
jgi:uncharacterized protein YyaL (SSP411 family)